MQVIRQFFSSLLQSNRSTEQVPTMNSVGFAMFFLKKKMCFTSSC